MITTKRLRIFVISNEEMQAKIEAEPDQEMKKAYSEMLAGCLQAPKQRIWYTIWLMQLNDGSKEIIGNLSFKGISTNGSVEIGYEVKPEYEGKGFMTEAVSAMVQWASAQPGVLCVEAETELNNLASQRVLQKSGFVPNGMWGEEGPRFVWQNY